MKAILTSHLFLLLFAVALQSPFLGHAQQRNERDSLAWLSLYAKSTTYLEEGKLDSALISAKQMSEKAKAYFGNTHISYASSINHLAGIYKRTGNYQQALLYYQNTHDVLKIASGERSAAYAMALNNLASTQKALGNPKLAEPLFIKALSLRKEILGEDDADYGYSIDQLAYFYEDIGEFTKSLPYYEQSLAFKKKRFGEESETYASALNLLANLQVSMGNFGIAVPLFLKTLDIQKRLLGEEHPTYLATLSNLAYAYQCLASYKKAEELYKSILTKRKDGDYTPTFITSMGNLADMYSGMGRYTEAETLFAEVLAITAKYQGKNQLDYATAMGNLSNLYQAMGEYQKAMELAQRSHLLREKLQGKNHPAYATSLTHIAHLQATIGAYAKAEALYMQALEIRKKTLGEKHPDYVSSINLLANLYASMANYNGAEKLYKEVIALREHMVGKSHPSFLTATANLAMLYRNMGLYDKAIPLFMVVSKGYLEALGNTHPDYLTIQENLAAAYHLTERYQEAKILYLNTLETQEKVVGTNHPTYISTLDGLANLYLDMGNYTEAEQLLNKSLQLNEAVGGKSGEGYAVALGKLSTVYYFSNQQQKWTGIINQAIAAEDRIKKNLLQRFSEAEKENYLGQTEYFSKVFLSMLYHFKPTDTRPFYQSMNARSGWLLRDSRKLNEQVDGSKDSTVKILAKKWKTNKAALASAAQLNEAERTKTGISLDSLEVLNKQLEKQLIALFPNLDSEVTKEGATAAQVGKRLRKGETLIHWTSFRFRTKQHWTDSVLYMAFKVSHGDTLAKIVNVFEEKQLQQLLNGYHGNAGRGTKVLSTSKKNSDQDAGLYRLIWAPLVPYLAGATKIYQIPSGLLHKVSFAAIKDSVSNKRLIEQFELHQLLSVDELDNDEAIKTIPKNMALFGGADYNSINKNIPVTPSTLLLRGGAIAELLKFDYLPGTKTEIDAISVIAASRLNVKKYSSIAASEENLKKIAGATAPEILHIATHGFYLLPPKAPTRSDTSDPSSAYPMLRSGLVLSGANNFLTKTTPIGIEDGIVTAQEISTMDLSDTELVVLSACQTALGDISVSEGVYGLQRAFKMAGAKKLMMSLWEVPDAETAELMKLFYGHVIKGDNYYDALRKAQLTLKAKYTDPAKWAGFVLIGG